MWRNALPPQAATARYRGSRRTSARSRCALAAPLRRGSKRARATPGLAGAFGNYVLLLGIETSCDDTATAVVRDGVRVLSNVSTNQDEFHAKYGGIVPEIASRRHAALLSAAVDEAPNRPSGARAA